MAAKLNNKLNYQPKEDDETLIVTGSDSMFKKYEEELEINDFPQQARWKVTSKVSSRKKRKKIHENSNRSKSFTNFLLFRSFFFFCFLGSIGSNI